MRVLVRVDSGIEIGTGHVMRCLTLAHALRKYGYKVVFVSKAHEGNIIGKIEREGFEVASLTVTDSASSHLAHSKWLGGSQQEDAKTTTRIIAQLYEGRADLIIVDHYGIDCEWESILRYSTSQIMIIDDLADRKHDCDFLLDQTFMRSEQDYLPYVPEKCRLMLGTQFSLLRKEFSLPVERIMQIRCPIEWHGVQRVLVMMGGTDHLNLSAKILDVLREDESCQKITVILGPTAPYYEKIKVFCDNDERISLFSDVSNVADLMLDHDICFGAAGTSSWERCAVGLPSILVAFAENQTKILSTLSQFGAASVFRLGNRNCQILEILENFRNKEYYQKMVKNCLKVCDGQGTTRVAEILIQ